VEADSLQARIEHERAELRAQYPHVTDCQAAVVQWNERGEQRYSLHLDIRWPQHQTLISGEATDSAEGAIAAAFRTARQRLQDALPAGSGTMS
jgi:hypothetical protein